jgi:hypothetical protein
MHQPNKLSAVLMSSVIIIIISIFPFLNFINIICCAGVIFGGAAGTFFYNNQLKKTGEVIHYKDGAAIGILSGIISALIIVIFTTLLGMIVNQNPIPEMYKIFDQYGVTIPPNADRFMQKISEEYSKHGFSITLTLLSLGIDLISYPLFSALGGLLAVTIFSRKKDAVQ